MTSPEMIKKPLDPDVPFGGIIFVNDNVRYVRCKMIGEDAGIVTQRDTVTGNVNNAIGQLRALNADLKNALTAIARHGEEETKDTPEPEAYDIQAGTERIINLAHERQSLANEINNLL